MIKKYRERYEKTRDVKNNDKTKKYILKVQRNANYYDRMIIKNQKKIIKLILYLLNEFN